MGQYRRLRVSHTAKVTSYVNEAVNILKPGHCVHYGVVYGTFREDTGSRMSRRRFLSALRRSGQVAQRGLFLGARH